MEPMFNFYPSGELGIRNCQDKRWKNPNSFVYLEYANTAEYWQRLLWYTANYEGLLLLDYLPHSRDDKKTETSSATLVDFHNVISDKAKCEMATLDPHSMFSHSTTNFHFTKAEIFSFFDNELESLISEAKEGNAIAIAPDLGAAKEVVEMFGLHNTHVFNKTRRLGGLDLKTLHAARTPDPGDYYLVVDDIYDGGATFTAVASHLGDSEIPIYLYTTNSVQGKRAQEYKQHITFKDLVIQASKLRNQDLERVMRDFIGSKAPKFTESCIECVWNSNR